MTINPADELLEQMAEQSCRAAEELQASSQLTDEQMAELVRQSNDAADKLLALELATARPHP